MIPPTTPQVTRMRMLAPLSLALVLACTALPALAAREYVAIQKRLTPEQMKATGLDQLTQAQLDLLDSLLREEQKTVVEATRKESETRVLGTWFGKDGMEPISSSVKGDLRGWSRGTVFTLENGQRWRVTEGDYYMGKPVSNPKVLIAPGKISGWYLQVEGHNPRPKVQRVD